MAEQSALIIRTAGIADIPIIHRIAHTTWPVAYAHILTPDALAYMLDFFYSPQALQEQMDNGQSFFIADWNSNPIGFGSISRYDDHSFKLNKLYVLPDIQKTGAGKALMHHAINLVKQHGADTLVLNVNRFNPAKQFYESRGFTVTGEEDVHLGNSIVQEDYIMKLNIADYRYH